MSTSLSRRRVLRSRGIHVVFLVCHYLRYREWGFLHWESKVVLSLFSLTKTTP